MSEAREDPSVLSQPARPPTTAIGEVPRTERDRITTTLFHQLEIAETPEARGRAQHEIVLVNATVARSIARRYHHRGVDSDDLEQVAYLALVKAVIRFDVHRGHDFLAFAVPSIDGEVKRHFRDHGWTVRLPRRLQEVQRLIEQELDFSPDSAGAALVEDLARRLGVPQAEVAAALQARACLPPTSLDATNAELVTGFLTASDCTEDDEAAADARAVLTPLLAALAPRDQRVLRLRYAEEHTQQEIADDLGVTQAQVSRILNRIHLELRDALDAPPAPPAAAPPTRAPAHPRSLSIVR